MESYIYGIAVRFNQPQLIINMQCARKYEKGKKSKLTDLNKLKRVSSNPFLRDDIVKNPEFRRSYRAPKQVQKINKTQESEIEKLSFSQSLKNIRSSLNKSFSEFSNNKKPKSTKVKENKNKSKLNHEKPKSSKVVENKNKSKVNHEKTVIYSEEDIKAIQRSESFTDSSDSGFVKSIKSEKSLFAPKSRYKLLAPRKFRRSLKRNKGNTKAEHHVEDRKQVSSNDIKLKRSTSVRLGVNDFKEEKVLLNNKIKDGRTDNNQEALHSWIQLDLNVYVCVSSCEGKHLHWFNKSQLFFKAF